MKLESLSPEHSMASTRALWVGIIVVASLLTFLAGRWAMTIWLSNEQYRVENNMLQTQVNMLRTEVDHFRTTRAEKMPLRESQKRPGLKNILLIIADDLRPQLGHLGFDTACTPNLDNLAAESTVFTRAYCQAPQCNPSRSSFLTGHSPDVARVFAFEATARENMGQRSAATIFDTMRSHGYLVLGTGKIFHFDPPSGTFSKENGDYFPALYDQEWGCTNGEPTGACMAEACKTQRCVNGRLYLDEKHKPRLFDARVSLEAVKKLTQASLAWQRNATPSFVTVGFHHPHLKWFIPEDLWKSSKLQDALSIVRPPLSNVPPTNAPFFAHGDVSIAGELRLLNGKVERLGEPFLRVKMNQKVGLAFSNPPSPDAQIEMRKAYLACVTFLDEQIGVVLAGLKNQGPDFESNTVVIVTSDHGFGLGENGHWGKSSLYEVDTRVPLIVRDPSIPQSRSRKSELLIELVDLYPSIIDLAGLPQDDILREAYEGRSFKTILQNRKMNTETWGRAVAVSMLAKCGGNGPLTSPSPPFLCKRRSNVWFENHGFGIQENDPPPLIGFAARSERWRYVAWMRHNNSLDAVDWSAPPYAQELYYHGAKSKQREIDLSFDLWDMDNIAKHRREVAARHLTILIEVSKRRRGLMGKYAWGRFDETFQPDVQLLHKRSEAPRWGSKTVLADFPAS